jgi:hypothetical protein
LPALAWHAHARARAGACVLVRAPFAHVLLAARAHAHPERAALCALLFKEQRLERLVLGLDALLAARARDARTHRSGAGRSGASVSQ